MSFKMTHISIVFLYYKRFAFVKPVLFCYHTEILCNFVFNENDCVPFFVIKNITTLSKKLVITTEKKIQK